MPFTLADIILSQNTHLHAIHLSSPLFITLVHTCHPTQGICVDRSTVHENHTFRLTSNATHLGIQRPLQLQHVGVLLGVDVVIGKIHQQTLNVEPARKQQRC